MDEKTKHRARRSATIVFPLALMLALLVGWSVWADEAPAGRDGAPVQYEIQLAGAGVDRLEILLPAGFEYVGLAPGSQVGTEPESSGSGGRLVWNGPFGDAEVLRFWLAPERSAEAPASLSLAETGAEAIRIESPAAPPLTQPPMVPSGEQAVAVTPDKSVELKPDWPSNLWVTYQILFQNDDPGTATLDWITDTLPSGFVFGGMAYGSAITMPPSIDGNVLVWDTSSYPEQATFADTLTMRYYVRAINRAGEYRNSVVALVGDQQVGPASATLTVERSMVYMPAIFRSFIPPAPKWELSKTANPTIVEPGDPVVYTVAYANNGNLAGTTGSLVDVLPDGFAYDGMISGPAPSVVGGTLTWTGPWQMAPGDSMNLSYRATTSGSGLKVNTISAYRSDGRQLASASSTVTLGGLPFVDEFTTESPDWHRFDNWPNLSPLHWDWAGVSGDWGIWAYDWTYVQEYTGFNLLIYDDPGAQSWTDYRIETSIRDSKDEQLLKGLTGVWFRGTYEDSGLKDGKSVGGYYVYMKVSDDTIYLMRTPQPAAGQDPIFYSQSVVASAPAGVGIRRDRWYQLVVEVRGANIKVWFQNSQNPIINWTDPNPIWSSGTVGLAVYNTTARWDYIHVLPLE